MTTFCTVKLSRLTPYDKDMIETLKRFREIWGFGLAEAKDMYVKIHQTGSHVMVEYRTSDIKEAIQFIKTKLFGFVQVDLVTVPVSDVWNELVRIALDVAKEGSVDLARDILDIVSKKETYTRNRIDGISV